MDSPEPSGGEEESTQLSALVLLDYGFCLEVVKRAQETRKGTETLGVVSPDLPVGRKFVRFYLV